MPPTLHPSSAARLLQLINTATSPTTPTPLPHALVHITDANNNILFSHGSSSGPRPSPTASSISIIQSLSKLIGAVAFMQLVEAGNASLDSPTLIPHYLPELAAKDVLTGSTVTSTGTREWTFERRKGDITPRMLMNHTYGGGHTYFNSLLYEYISSLGQGVWEKKNEASDPYATLLVSPLLWQPGSTVNYGQGFDWLAVLIERITGRDLGEYLHERVLGPLGMRCTGYQAEFGGDITQQLENEGLFWPRQVRTLDGFSVIDSMNPKVVERGDAFPNGRYHAKPLGTGLVSTADEYTSFLSIFLPQNAGTSPKTGYAILSPSSITEITSAQLTSQLQNMSRTIPSSAASPIILPTTLSSPEKDPRGSFGLGVGVQGATRTLSDGRRGRSKGSVYWYGAANTEVWVDGEKGVVVFVNGNYYPWNEGVWGDFVAGVEGILYEGLVEEG